MLSTLSFGSHRWVVPSLSRDSVDGTLCSGCQGMTCVSSVEGLQLQAEGPLHTNTSCLGNSDKYVGQAAPS